MGRPLTPRRPPVPFRLLCPPNWSWSKMTTSSQPSKARLGDTDSCRGGKVRAPVSSPQRVPPRSLPWQPGEAELARLQEREAD